ncbi:MAG: creatininase family protein [Candidatus Helarchaeota archaeon]|nr:creatininase family protein [Candidatus Helarchaeota archaeon]
MSNQDPKRIEIIDLYRNQKPIYEDGNLTLVRLESLTRNGLNKLEKNDALVIIPIAPIEVHGNFLPIGSDYIESILMVELIKETLKEERSNNHYTIVEAPGIPIGTGSLRSVEGTLDIGHRAFRNCVIDFIDGLVRAGFKRFLIITVHHGMIHAYALEEAADKIVKRYRKKDVRVASPVHWMAKTLYMDDPKKVWSKLVEKLGQKPLSDEELEAIKHDHHASIMETCFMKKINPDLVDPEYKTSGPIFDGIGNQFLGLLTSRYKYDHQGLAYNGNPSMTDNRDWYSLYVEKIKEIGLDFIDALYNKDPDNFKPYLHSHIWQFKFLKTNFKQYFIVPFIIFMIVLPWILFFLNTQT